MKTERSKAIDKAVQQAEKAIADGKRFRSAKKLLKDLGQKATYRAIANLGKSRIEKQVGQGGDSPARVRRCLALIEMPEKIREWALEGKLTLNHIDKLVGLPRRDQTRLSKRAVEHNLSADRMIAWDQPAAQEHESKQVVESEDAKDGSAEAQGSSDSASSDPNMRELETGLGEYLGIPVVIHLEKNEMVMKYFNNDVLDGILEKIGYK